jgi:hemin uptake protein HemP
MSVPFDSERSRPAVHQGSVPATGYDAIPVHEAGALTHGGNVAHIRLDAQTYTLRITRQGKLILTK